MKELIARHILAEDSDRPTPFGEREAREARETHEMREPRQTRLGSVTLHPHQLSAIRRIESAIEEFGGALLCDEVGMGKTFVALAMAKSFASCVVVAPAVLRDMWSQQSQVAGVQLRFVSFEQLSRGRRPGGHFDLVVIDEAHHARNRATRRYAELSRMVMRSQVLLLSATPIHNSFRDLSALLALFLGSRSEALSRAEIARCVIRREVEAAGLASRIPATGALRWLEITDDHRIPGELMALPPPLPVRDGGLGGVLIQRSLLRQWCSSDAALESALRRRLGRSLALIEALESGHYPSEGELSAWTIAEDSVQLAFPSFVATPVGETSGMLEAIRRHQAGLRALLRSLKRLASRDAERARLLTGVRRAHPGVPIVAFSQYAETVNALLRELRGERGVAALTAKGARVAGGSLTRRETLSRFAPRASGARAPREAERIDLLLTTDLLSEGVNLQDAGVVVHLDLPWTGARLEQRMGRVARLGSERRQVFAYGIRPSHAGEALIRIESTITRKLAEMRHAIGAVRPVLPGDSHETPDSIPAPSSAAERIRAILNGWMDERPSQESMPAVECNSIRVGAVASERNAFLALCTVQGKFVLLTSGARGMSDDPAELLETMFDAEGAAADPAREMIESSLRSVEQYFRANRTIGAASGMTAVALARRAALRRVSATIERARPHMRTRLVQLGAAARRAILGRMNSAAESELAQMVSLEIPDEEWLLAAAGFDDSTRVGASPAESGESDDHPRIVALLLLQRRPSVIASDKD
ncbi:MAG TPA: DEAD/DEAH box helicase [Gemmatimonadaceae bacterium]|nr:DEAD/DEAH box helicase [Gemmatimonadaceae bacterium]